MSSTEAAPHEGDRWEYLVVPLADARRMTKQSSDLRPDHLNELGSQGWEAVGLALRNGDLLAGRSC